MTTTPLTDLSPEILQNILEYVGDPTLGQVSKSMQKNITAVTKLELQKIWDKVKRSPNDFEDLNYTQHVFRNIAIAYKKRIPLMDRIDGNMPRICYERFHCIYKKIIAQDTLTVWKQLPGGENYLNTPIMQTMPLEHQATELSHWIENNPDMVRDLKILDLSAKELCYLPNEIGKLSQLNSLYSIGNQLTSLPKEIMQLPMLKELLLDKNQLTRIPLELAVLRNLNFLGFSRNPLQNIPDLVFKSKHLGGIALGCLNYNYCNNAIILKNFLEKGFSELSTENQNAVCEEINRLKQLNHHSPSNWTSDRPLDYYDYKYFPEALSTIL